MIVELIFAALIGVFLGWFILRIYLKVKRKSLTRKSIEQLREGKYDFYNHGKKVNIDDIIGPQEQVKPKPSKKGPGIILVFISVLIIALSIGLYFVWGILGAVTPFFIYIVCLIIYFIMRRIGRALRSKQDNKKFIQDLNEGEDYIELDPNYLKIQKPKKKHPRKVKKK